MSWRMDKNKFWLGGRRFNTASPRFGAPTQRKARPQVGRPNAMQGTSASWVLERTSVTQTQGTSAHLQVGHHNATQGTSAIWPPKRKTHPQRKHPHKGALGLKMSWRMDKNKFWLGGRLFNTASPRLGVPTQCRAFPQAGHPNATQGTSASWAPQCNARHIRKLGAPTHVRNANARHVRTSASWAPQRNTRHVRKLRSPTYVYNANARHVRKMVSQTQNSSVTKTSTQGSTRLKDKLEDG
jgi:hypothetical protein